MYTRMIKLGSKAIKDVYLGNKQIAKIYKGSQLVFQKVKVTRISGNIQFTEPRDSIELFCNVWLYGGDSFVVPLTPNGDFDFIIDTSQMENIWNGFSFNNMFYTRWGLNEDVTKVTINELTVNPEETYITDNMVEFEEMLYHAPNLSEVNFNIDCGSLCGAFKYCPLLTKVSIPKVTLNDYSGLRTKFKDIFLNSPNINYIKCKQSVKDYFLNNIDFVGLPATMQEGGSGVWEIVNDEGGGKLTLFRKEVKYAA